MKFVVALVALLGLMAPAAHAQAPSDFVGDVNALRAEVGLPALVVDGDAAEYARWWAGRMAETNTLAHSSPSDRAGIPGAWTVVGENVGAGVERGTLMAMFVASPTHYANIVRPGFDRVGVGVSWGSDGRMYVAFIFLDEDIAPVVEAPPPPAPPPPHPAIDRYAGLLLRLADGVA